MTLLKTVFVYGIGLAGLTGSLKVAEYRFYARDLSTELYVAFLGALFMMLGIWIGRRLTREAIAEAIEPGFEMDRVSLKALGITKREHEVLELIAAGLSNQEIADRLFVSMSTIKSHTSSLFSKLGASRRTQATQRARELGILE